MTKASLETVVDALVEIIDGWNDAAADEDRGRSNDTITLTLFDDGSGFLGKRGDFGGEVKDIHEFGDVDDLLKILRSEGVEIT